MALKYKRILLKISGEALGGEKGMGFDEPTMDAILGGVNNAVITSSLVFMAVFIPVSFMSGTSGTFYTQFGLTMAVAVGISAINALTLSPALCALLLRPYINEDGTQKNNFAARFRNSFNAAFDVVAGNTPHCLPGANFVEPSARNVKVA